MFHLVKVDIKKKHKIQSDIFFLTRIISDKYINEDTVGLAEILRRAETDRQTHTHTHTHTNAIALIHTRTKHTRR